jgi:uncharacterized protein YeeX (DUF496 family)
MNTTKFKCNYCFKEYSRKSFYNKHILCCEILNNSQKDNTILREENETPSINQLYLIIKELTFNFKKLNNEMTEIKKHVYKTKKKVYLLDWLNEKIKPKININSYIQNININISEIKKHGFEKGIQYSFEKENNIPLCCFNQNQGSLFIYEDKWITCTSEMFENLINTIHSTTLRNISNIESSDDNYCDLIKQFVHKKLNYKLIKKNIYNQLKTNLTNIIEYEFI